MKVAMKTPGMKSNKAKNTNSESGSGYLKGMGAGDDGLMGVADVKVGESSTMWGGLGADAKPSCNYDYDQLAVDRNYNPSNEGHGGKV